MLENEEEKNLLVILEYVRKNPGLPASKIAKKLDLTRRQINSILYKNNKELFFRVDNGEKAPTWKILDSTKKINQISKSDGDNSPMENQGKRALQKVLQSIEFALSEKKNFSSKTGHIKCEIVLVSEGFNAPHSRFEILDTDDLIIIINEDNILSNSSNSELPYHVLHCIADCVTEYRMLRTEVIEEGFISIKNTVWKNLLTLSISSDVK